MCMHAKSGCVWRTKHGVGCMWRVWGGQRTDGHDTCVRKNLLGEVVDELAVDEAVDAWREGGGGRGGQEGGRCGTGGWWVITQVVLWDVVWMVWCWLQAGLHPPRGTLGLKLSGGPGPGPDSHTHTAHLKHHGVHACMQLRPSSLVWHPPCTPARPTPTVVNDLLAFAAHLVALSRLNVSYLRGAGVGAWMNDRIVGIEVRCRVLNSLRGGREGRGWSSPPCCCHPPLPIHSCAHAPSTRRTPPKPARPWHTLLPLCPPAPAPPPCGRQPQRRTGHDPSAPSPPPPALVETASPPPHPLHRPLPHLPHPMCPRTRATNPIPSITHTSPPHSHRHPHPLPPTLPPPWWRPHLAHGIHAHARAVDLDLVGVHGRVGHQDACVLNALGLRAT